MVRATEEAGLRALVWDENPPTKLEIFINDNRI
jgi:hypothetical protein